MSSECRIQSAECRVSSAHTACGILPGEEMVLISSTKSVIIAYYATSGKLCFKNGAKFRVRSTELIYKMFVQMCHLERYVQLSKVQIARRGISVWEPFAF